MPPELSVVVPVYGSANILPDLVAALEHVLAPSLGTGNFEVLLVHDHGPDHAWPTITELAGSRPWLRGIDLRLNAGQHNAIMAGLAHASGRYLVTMDDDLQHDPADIPRILDRLRAGADVCYVQFLSRHHAAWKRFGSRFNDRIARWLLGKPIGLYLSPFRGLHSSIRDEMVRYSGPFVYVDGLILQSTGNIATIEATHHPRQDGRSGYSLRKSISLWLQMATSFSVAPLRLATVVGLVFSLFGFVLAVLLALQKLAHPDTTVGWTSLMVAMLIIGGIQLLALGAIGEYVGRVLLNVTNRPQYVIGRSVNLPQDSEGVTGDDRHKTV